MTARHTAKAAAWMTVLPALAVMIFGLLLTQRIYRYVDQTARAARQAQFLHETGRIATALSSRLQAYEQVLRGGVGLFGASDAVNREEWRRYVDAIDINETYPGVQAIAFARHLHAAELDAYQQQIRREGYADYSVFPAGARTEYAAIEYIEPFTGRNQRAFGYDMFSEATRRAAMTMARDSGRAVLTGPVQLMQENGEDLQVGTLLYLPVYRAQLPPHDVIGRRHDLFGYVYAPFRMGDLIRPVLTGGANGVHLQLSDVDGGTLFDDRPDKVRPILTASRRMDLYGRHWQLRFAAMPGFGGGASMAPATAVAGVICTLLLALVTLLLGSGRQRAQLLAQRMTASLRENEAYQRAIVDSGAEGILTIDERGFVQTFNRAAEQMFGYPSPEVIGRNVSMLMPARFRGDPAHDVMNFNPDRDSRIVGLRREVTGLRADGKEFPMSLSINVIDAEGQRRFVGVVSDISERRAAEQALRDSEERFRLMVSSVSDHAIIRLDPEGHVSTWNEGAQRIKGYKADEIIGQHFACFYTPEDLAAGKPAHALQIAADKGQFADENWRLRKGGERFWASVVITALRDPGGKLVGFVKVVRDLSERRSAEEAIAEANRFRQSILDGAAFGIVATDASGRISATNPAAERLWWYRRNEMVGSLQLTDLINEADLEQRASALAKEFGVVSPVGFEALKLRADRGLADEHEWNGRRKDGSSVPLEIAITARRDADGAIVGYLAMAYDITERRRREEYVRHIAHHDALTQLPNRSLFSDRAGVAIVRARREHTQVGVMMIDLDNFKRINDSLGHHVGDQMLITVAARLKECVRECDSIARMGGDEFAILLPDIRDAANIVRIAEAVTAAIDHPVVVGAHELHVTASVGISTYPDAGDDPATLLKNADTAMYKAKVGGRNGYRIFTQDMLLEAEQRIVIETELRRALARGEFEMHYEPQVTLQTGEVFGVEALIRWRHPERGLVSPAEFLSIAEETGLIVPIGYWTLHTACREAAALQKRLAQRLTVAVNLSPKQFAHSELMQNVQSALAHSGLAAELLVLEITEGALMANSDETMDKLHALRGMGIEIAVDDFGTGYSSLSYITRFPIDLLKIDRSFVRDIIDDPADAAVARAIIAMAHGLGIKVIAEGVETMEQLTFLRERTCDAAQGHYIGRGAPIDTFALQGYHFCKPTPASDLPAKIICMREARERNAL